MKGRLVTGSLLAALVVAASLFAPQEVSSPSPRGIEYFSVKYGAWGLARVRVIRFDPDDYELRLLKPSAGETLERVSAMPGCDQAVACFNGPFFEEEGAQPLGLLVSGSTLWQPLRNVSWGVFWIDLDNRPHIARHNDFKRHVDPRGEVAFAIQSGPTTLLASDVKKKDSHDVARRTSIGIDSKGRILVLVANFPVKLASLAEFARERLDATDLMNLDGGSSTQLVVGRGKQAPKVMGFPVAVGVGIYPRDKTSSSGPSTDDSSK